MKNVGVITRIAKKSMEHRRIIKNFTPGNRVAVFLPIPSTCKFDYLVPAGLFLRVGDLVKVSFRGRRLIGVIWGNAVSNLSESRLKRIDEKIESLRLREDQCRFIDWVAEYTISSPGAVLRMVLNVPSVFQKLPEKTVFFLKNINPDIALTKTALRIVGILSDGRARSGRQLSSEAECSHGAIKRLVDRGIIGKRKSVNCSKFEPPDYTRPGFHLNSQQECVAENLKRNINQGFNVTLVDGVPGAGKTEVYFEALGEALKHNYQVLVLLPEIALGAQWMERFHRRFGCFPGQWHSDVTKARRRDTWRAVSHGEVSVVVGARSALFLPFKNLGLIIIDEEHEQSYKQEDGVIYNARDMAIIRAKLGNFSVILASGTPSLETTTNVKRGRYNVQHLRLRHGNLLPPSIQLVDLRKSPPKRGNWLSPVMEKSLRKTFMAREQAVLFINRRGYAPLTLCKSCGYRFHCPDCAAWLVEHRWANRLQCHYCGYKIKLPSVCPSCGVLESLTSCGPGVERLAEEIEERFPNIRYIVATSDTINSPRTAIDLVRKIEDYEVDLIIGTQIIAKGYHFPLITFVGVVDADLGLSGGDLRAAERTYQLLYQVVGRAGRGERSGKALLQTYLPDHPIMVALANGNREEFLNAESEARRLNGMPPFGRLVSFIVSGRDEQVVDYTARRIGCAAPQNEKIRVLGPAPAPISLLRGRHRRRLLLIASRDTVVQPLVARWFEGISIPNKVRIQIDVDPYSFL